MEKKKCAIVIPHYNNLQGLYRSLKSIYSSQSVQVVIVDDGSTKKPDEFLIQQCINLNVSVYLILLEQNQGIENALNIGIEYCLHQDFEFIARLDCGDICSRDRFDLQIEFLERNHDIAIVGSWVKFFWNERDIFLLKLPIDNKKINKYKYLNSPFCHPSIMVRSRVFTEIGLYSKDYLRAEDYELYFRILKKFKGANIPKYLTASELNPFGISLSYRKRQIISRLKIQCKYYNLFSLHSNFGIVRTIIIYLVPYRILQKVKKILFNVK